MLAIGPAKKNGEKMPKKKKKKELRPLCRGEISGIVGAIAQFEHRCQQAGDFNGVKAVLLLIKTKERLLMELNKD